MAKTGMAESSLRAHFAAARSERAAAASSAQIKADRLAVRTWQQTRLAATHAALLASEKYGPATTFFLTELYSTADLTQRDADIERVIRILVKFLPEKALRTLASALEMDALSEKMDNQLVAIVLQCRVVKAIEVNEQEFVGEREVLAEQAVSGERTVVIVEQRFIAGESDWRDLARRQKGDAIQIVRLRFLVLPLETIDPHDQQVAEHKWVVRNLLP